MLGAHRVATMRLVDVEITALETLAPEHFDRWKEAVRSDQNHNSSFHKPELVCTIAGFFPDCKMMIVRSRERVIAYIPVQLRERGPDAAQVLIVETSSTDQYARTREFYPKRGFVEEARIRRFYGPDDDKVVFWKSLTSRT